MFLKLLFVTLQSWKKPASLRIRIKGVEPQKKNEKLFDNQKIHYSTNTNQSVIHTLSIVDSSVEMAFAHVQERASSHARVTASVELRSSSSNSTCHLVSSNRSYKYKQKLNDSWI